jgi:hypothetical protein
MIVALIIAAGYPGLFGNQLPEAEKSNKELIAKLNEFRRLRDNGRFIPALQAGYEAASNEDLFCNADFPKQESLLFEVATAQLEYVDKILNSVQARQCSGKAAFLWKKYVDWHHRLTGEQRSSLHVSHVRINVAVAFLGNSLIRKGEIFELFDEYAGIAALNLSYFGTDAMSVWKKGLYGCPDGNVRKPHTAANRKSSIENGCDGQWNNYASVLKDWVRVAPLQNSTKSVYEREIGQIEREILNCGGAA